jgi:hypothetical protein
MSNFVDGYARMTETQGIPGLRASYGDLVLIPARVRGAGSDGRSIRLFVEKGLPSIRVTKSSNGSGEIGYINPELVYNPFQRMPSCIVERMATSAPLDSVSRDLQSLGHTKEQADVMAMSAPWIRNHAAFTDKDKMVHMASAVVSASSSAMSLSLSHATKSDWKQSATKAPKDATQLWKEFRDMTNTDREMWEHDMPPSKYPAVMLASGLVPEEDLF